MKKTWIVRILSLVLVALLLIGLVPAIAQAAAETTVYLDPANGADTNTGLSEDTAVATLEAAYEKLIAASPERGKIVFLGNLTINAGDALTLPAHSFPVTLTGKTAAMGFGINNTVNFSGDTTLENMTVTLTKASNSYFLCGGGHKFVIGENVTAAPCVSGSTSYRFGLIGTYRLAGTDQVDMTVKSGTWRVVYGVYGQTVSGDITMDIQGGTITTLSPAFNNDIGGDAKVTVTNATITGIYLASHNTNSTAIGTAKGDVTLTLGTGAKVTSVYCGPSGKFCVDGTVSVILDGITNPITNLSGTGKVAGTGTIGASRLVLKSGTLTNLPASFDKIELDVAPGKTLNLGYSGRVQADSFTGGGNLTLGADTALEITGPVSGKTACSISGTVSDSLVYITAPSHAPADAFAFENAGITLKSAFTKQWSAAQSNAVSITGTAGTRYYASLAEAVAAYGETDQYITLWEDVNAPVEVGKQIVLDMNGYDAAITLTSGGKVYGMDSTTNDFAIGNTPCGILKVTGGAPEIASSLTWGDTQYRYVALQEADGYTFHRFALETKKGLRPYNAAYGVALYYQPYFYGDEAVAAQINTGTGNAYGVYVTPDNGGSPIYASIRSAGGVFDAATDNSKYRIVVPELIPSNEELDNGSKTIEIHDLSDVVVAGQAYIRIGENCFYDDTAASLSLRSAIEQVNASYDSLNQTQQTALKTMFLNYSQVLEGWKMLTLQLAAGYENLEKEAETVKILAIGNSYSLDALWHLGVVAKSQGFEKNVQIGILYYNGCPLSTHVKHLTGDLPNYTYYRWDGSKWTSTKNVTMKQALQDEYWDIITMQQASVHSGRESTYNEDIATIINYVDTYKRCATAELVWHMTWSYPEDASLLALGSDGFRSNFEKYYGSNQTTMYNAIVSAVNNKILTNSRFSQVVPNGTMVMNARSSYLEDADLFRDYTHLNDYGRCIAAHLMYAKLLKRTDSITAVKLDAVPKALRHSSADRTEDLELTEEMKNILLESVNNALKTPFAVTQSQYKELDASDIVYEDACVLGHTAENHQAVTCSYPLLKWTGWTKSDALPTTTGNYRLTKNVTLTTQASLSNNQNVIIDLNGKSIASSNRVALIQGSANLTITDTSSADVTKQGTVKTTNTTLDDSVKGGGVIYVHTGKLTVYGGNFDGTSITSQSTNSAAYCGSVLHILSTGEAEILGGTMTGGFSWRGGTIYNQGQLTIGGNAVINGGNTSNMGAAIYNDKEVTLEGNSVLNCGTSTGGGCYGVIGGKITITGNATINRNSASQVVMALNKLTLDVTISGNATINGQIQITNTSNYYRNKLTIADTPVFVLDATNPALYFVAWNNDAQKQALDLSGLTGGSGLTVRLPSSARTGVFGTGAKSLLTTGGVVQWVKSNDSSYMIILNADNKLEMVETAVIPEALSATFVGDSITNGQGATAGNRYWELLEQQTKLEQVFGLGINGSTYSTQSDFKLEHDPLTTRYDQIRDTDLIFIFLGTNDFGRNTPMGQITDTEDVSFYGAMNLSITEIQKAHPDSRIVLLTPINRFDKTVNDLGLTLQDYIAAIKAVAQKHELDLIDMNTLTKDIFVEANRATLMDDTVHPNDAGHVYLANAIKSWIEANI